MKGLATDLTTNLHRAINLPKVVLPHFLGVGNFYDDYLDFGRLKELISKSADSRPQLWGEKHATPPELGAGGANCTGKLTDLENFQEAITCSVSQPE